MVQATPLINGYPLYNINQSGYLTSSDQQHLFYQVSGNPLGVPILILHGGPGAGSSAEMRCFFDPSYFQVIQIDQRGSGRSLPYANIQHNTTQFLLADLEQLRKYLQITRWVLFGASWGSTLALAYAQAYPQSCLSLVLSGILLGERQEIEWFLQGSGAFFPKAWQALRNYIPYPEALLTGYHQRVTHSDPTIHLPAAQRLCHYGGSIATFGRSETSIQRNTNPQTVLALARISLHYWINDYFLTPGQILQQAPQLHSIPITLIQGQYDMITPPGAAFKLASALPNAQLILVTQAGHAIREPAMCQALFNAIEALKAIH